MKRISALPLFLGAAAFFLSQIVLRIPLLNAASGQDWYIILANQYYIPFILLICLSAGLFEETARLGGALILKTRRTYKDIISFGIGHAFCELIILIGFTHVNNVIVCLAVNNPGGAFASLVPPELPDTAAGQIASVNPAHVYLGLLERISAVMFHIFATVLVFKGVIERKMIYYVLAILAHTVFNFAGLLLTQYTGIVAAEIALFLMALAAGYYTLRTKSISFQER